LDARSTAVLVFQANVDHILS